MSKIKLINKYQDGTSKKGVTYNTPFEDRPIQKLPKAAKKMADWADSWNKSAYETGLFENQLGNGELERQAARRRTVKFTDNVTSFGFNSAVNLWNNPDRKSLLTPEFKEYSKKYIGDVTDFIINNPDITGMYDKKAHTALAGKYDTSAQQEELMHASGAKPQNEVIKEIIGEPKDPYLDDSDEVYVRLMQYRKDKGLDPKKRNYTTEDIQNMQKPFEKQVFHLMGIPKKDGRGLTQYETVIEDDTYNLFNRYTPEQLTRLFNEVAHNKINTQTDNTNQIYFAKEGSKLIKKYQEGTTKDGITTSSFNPPKIVLTDEQKALAATSPEQRGKVMQAAYLQNMRDYAKAWYSERYKNPKYKDQLAGNMDKINALLDIEGYTPMDQVSVKLGGKKPVAAGGLDVDGGYVEASKSIDGKPFWFGKTRDAWWHEGIGHWVSESVPGLLSKNPGTYMKYLGGNATDLTYQNYINKLKERHSDTWAFRGLNKDLRDAKGNLYIDPNRQLTPEDVDEMKKNPRFRLPSQWQNTNIDSEGIANMHNTFASNDLNKKQGQYDILLSKKGNKLIKK